MLQMCHCVQINALFCCLWHNVQVSCHKHFVVFSGNEQRRLLPAMCHNLRHAGRALPATALTTLDNGWPHNALRHHWLMSISCHFRDCKALLVTSLTHVSGAIASVQTFTFTCLLQR